MDDKQVAFAQGTNIQILNTQTFACVQTFHPEYTVQKTAYAFALLFIFMQLNETYALSSDLKRFVMIRGTELLIHDLADGSKVSVKTDMSVCDYIKGTY